jgi:hypothetical protein
MFSDRDPGEEADDEDLSVVRVFETIEAVI